MTRFRVEDIDVDKVWIALGPWGKYQWKQISSLMLMCVSWVLHQLSIVFIGFRPNFECRPFPNDTSSTANESNIRREYGQCSVKTYTNTSNGVVVSEDPCENGWTYDIPKEQSFVTEWDHVCDNASLAELTQTLLIIGMVFGSLGWTSISDRFGRKPVMVASNLILFGITVGTAFSPNYYVFLVLRVLTGAVSQGGLTATTLAVETLPMNERYVEEVLALFSWTTAVVVMSPIAYALRNVSWRYLQITYAALGAWAIIHWWMVDESLRWVIANGQLKRAREIIKKACRWNRKDYETVLRDAELTEIFSDLHLETFERKSDQKESKEKETVDSLLPLDAIQMNVKQLTVLDIFKHSSILKVSLIMWFIWVTDSLVYYGLYMISSDFYGDRYINFLLSGAIEYPACLFEYLCLNRMGRKMTCFSCHLVAAIGLVVATALTYSADGNSTMLTAATAFTLIGKMGITGAFSTVYLITPELYPTNMRNSGLGVSSCMGKFGAMIAPFFRNVPKTIAWLPGAIFSLMCIIVVLLISFLPETHGIELPQSLDELTVWYKTTKFSLNFGKNRLADVIQKKKEQERLKHEREMHAN